MSKKISRFNSTEILVSLPAQTVQSLFEMPFFDVLSKAHQIHKQHFQSDVELCALINIKVGGCPENCGFCHQSAHFKTNLQKEPLKSLDDVIEIAKKLKALGVKRCCMGAAWRHPPKRDFPKVLQMIQGVKEIGLETCVTLGFLDNEQADQLKCAGLDYYNHNLESSREFYPSIVTTHSFDDRVKTVETVGQSGLKVCCGGIFGLGETRDDRIGFFESLLALEVAPTSIPINRMIHFSKTPLENVQPLDIFEFVRTIAVARILFPKSRVRLSGGRLGMSPSEHALCFYAGANSIFVGDTLLTAKNQKLDEDLDLLKRLDLSPLSGAMSH